MIRLPPSIFNRDQTKADYWLDKLKMYFRVNCNVAGFNSPMRKVTITLSYIKGPQVAGWVCNFGNILDQLHPDHNNIPAVWEQFLLEFEQQFIDSQ